MLRRCTRHALQVLRRPHHAALAGQRHFSSQPLDKVLLKGLEFHGYHGFFPSEKELGQKFVVDAELSLNFRSAGLEDDLDQTVNYARVVEDIEAVMTGDSIDLIEAVGEKLCDTLLQKYPKIQQVQVTVKKPQVPIPATLDYVAVQLTRTRN